MTNFYVLLIMIFALCGAFCFNMGHRRAYKIVLKNLLKGQFSFLSQQVSYFNENKEHASKEELIKAFCNYEIIGQHVIGWYKSFGMIGDDRELKTLKSRIKELLESYLSALESTGGKDTQ